MVNISAIKHTLKNQFLGVGIGLLGLMLLFRSFIRNPGDLIWGNEFDPNLMVWIMEWGFHILIERGSPLEFWNSNQFYPVLGSLAFSDSLLSAQLVYAPLRFLGISPINSLMCVLAAFTLLGCYLTNLMLWRFNFTWIERCILIYCAHFSLSTTSFLSVHYQLFAFQLAPAFLLSIYIWLQFSNIRYFYAAVALFCIATGFATYFAPMSIALIMLMVFIIIACKLVQFSQIKNACRSINYYAALFAIIILITLYFIQLRPYQVLFLELSQQSWAETYKYSARLFSFFTNAPSTSYIYKYLYVAGDYGYWERAYFPGFAIIVFTLTAFYLYKKRANQPLIAVSGNGNFNISILQYSIVIFITAYILSLGQYLEMSVVGYGISKIYLPMAILAKLIPGVENIRAPGRFGLFFGLSYGIFVIYSLRYLQSRVTGFGLSLKMLRVFTPFVILFIIIVDNLTITKVYGYEVPHKSFYIKNSRFIPERTPLVVFPLFNLDHMGTLKNYMDHLKGSMFHYGWLVSGYGSRTTKELSQLTANDRSFQLNQYSFEDLLDQAEKIGVERAIIFINDYSPMQQNEIRLALSKRRILYADSEGIIVPLKSAMNY